MADRDFAEYGVPVKPADLHHHRLIGYRFITNNRILPLILNDHGEQLRSRSSPWPVNAFWRPASQSGEIRRNRDARQ